MLYGHRQFVMLIGADQAHPYHTLDRFIRQLEQNDHQAEVVGACANDRGDRRIVAMAPNYQAGKDAVAGFKRTYEGEVIDEIYTPLNQPDFAAELAQVAAKRPDAIYVLYPGGLGVNFVRQYQQAGLLGRIPLLSSSTTDGSTLPALREAALGVISGTFWGPDFDNPANKRFVEEFERKHNRIPSQYAAQSYDAALLLDSAIAQVRGNVADKDAFRAALKAADFQSVRGSFRFGNNHFPVQDHHIFEVARDAQDRVSLKTIATPLRNHVDAYASQCRM
jgi:branched-chain amino acid transport system substrate-binding protein